MCGIATFTHDLHKAIAGAAPKADCYVVAVTDKAKSYDYPEAVRLEFQEKNLRAYRQTADFLNFKNADVLCVQHGNFKYPVCNYSGPLQPGLTGRPGHSRALWSVGVLECWSVGV